MKKLLRYEFEITSRRYLMLFLLYFLTCTLFSLIMGISLRHAESLAGIAFYGMIGVLVYFIYKNYTQIMLTSYRYLTKTLPYSNHQLLFSQIILSFLWTVCGLFIMFFGVQIIYAIAVSNFEIGFLMIIIPPAMTSLAQLLKVMIMLVLSLLMIILVVYSICTLTHSCYVQRYHLLFEVVLSAISLFCMFSLFSDSHIGILSLSWQDWGISLFIYSGILSILYIFIQYLLKQKMND